MSGWFKTGRQEAGNVCMCVNVYELIHDINSSVSEAFGLCDVLDLCKESSLIDVVE